MISFQEEFREVQEPLDEVDEGLAIAKGRLTPKGLCITGQIRQGNGGFFFAKGLAVQRVAQSKRRVQTEQLWTGSREAIHRE